MDSPRMWSWENRFKLVLLNLAYAFLLSLLASYLAPPMEELLINRRHRTGGRNRQTAIPLRTQGCLQLVLVTSSTYPEFGMTHELQTTV